MVPYDLGKRQALHQCFYHLMNCSPRRKQKPVTDRLDVGEKADLKSKAHNQVATE